jgi:nucleoid-associated protein YgaU
MKKLLILLAALSLVACSSNEPKEDVAETAPVVTEVVVEETPAVVEEEMVAEEAPAIEEETPIVEEEVIVEDVTMADETPASYTVVEGDNLFRIGLKYNMSWKKLAEENNISNPDVIEAGQVLTIPAK